MTTRSRRACRPFSLSFAEKRERMKHARAKHARRIVFCVRERGSKKKKREKASNFSFVSLSTTVVDERLPMARANKTSWLRRLSRLSVIAAGATAGIGVAVWLLPEEDGENDDGFFAKDASSSSPFGRSGFDDDDEDLMFQRRHQRRHQRPTFASKPLHPPSPPSFLAQLTVRLSVLRLF